MFLPSWSLNMTHQQYISFLETPQSGMCFSTTLSPCVFFSIWITHQVTNGSTSKFHFEASAPTYPFQCAFRWDIWSPSCMNFIMLWPKRWHLAYSSTNLSSLSIILLSFLHNILYVKYFVVYTNMLMCFYMTVLMPFGTWRGQKALIFLPLSLFFIKKFRSHYKGCKHLPS